MNVRDINVWPYHWTGFQQESLESAAILPFTAVLMFYITWLLCFRFRASLESVCHTMKYQIMYRALKGCTYFLILNKFMVVIVEVIGMVLAMMVMVG